MLQLLPTEADLLCLHPMFGPESGKDDPPLEVLNLRNNSIGDEGASALAQVIEREKERDRER